MNLEFVLLAPASRLPIFKLTVLVLLTQINVMANITNQDVDDLENFRIDQFVKAHGVFLIEVSINIEIEIGVGGLVRVGICLGSNYIDTDHGI